MSKEKSPGLRVIMVTPNFYPYIGGAEKQALELSKTLASMGVGVLVVTRRTGDLPAAETVEGIEVRRIFAAGSGVVNALTFLASCLVFLSWRCFAYDVIHVHLAGSPALAACLAGLIFRKRVFVKVGGGRGIGEIAQSSRSWTGGLKLMLLRLFRPRFIAVTEDLKEEMAEFGIGEGARVIPNGVDIDRYRPATDEEKRSAREGLGWPEGLCFLYVGRLAPEKRLEDFLEAFSRGAGGEERPAFCVFVGSGSERERLRLRADELGLRDRVRIVPPTGEIDRFYAAADIFVLPSVSEGLSNALLEAMSAGLALLGSRVGGTKEAVTKETGTLFKSGDVAGLTAAVSRYVSRPELAMEQGRAARKTAVERYSLKRVAERYMEIYT